MLLGIFRNKPCIFCYCYNNNDNNTVIIIIIIS